MYRRGVLTGIAVLLLTVAVLYALLVPPAPLKMERANFVLTDVMVVNPGAEREDHQDLAIRDGKIVSISPHVKGTAESDYAGGYVLPGLIDMHVHHPVGWLSTDIKYFDLLHLAHGVTTVRDTGSIDGSTFKTRKQIADGDFAGPRLFACGPIIDGDPPAWPGARVVHNAAEAEAAVDEIAANGADCIKVYSNLSSDALRGARAGATKHHLTLVGHVPFAVPMEEAHIDDVQHLTGVPGVPAKAGELGLIGGMLEGWDAIDDARIDAVVRASMEQKLAHTPTITVIQQLLRLRNYPELVNDPGAAMLPRYYSEFLWKPGGIVSWSVPAMNDAQAGRILANFGKVVRRLHDAGVTLHVGTDTFNPFVVPGVSMHQELRNFADHGFTPEQALSAATRENGEALSMPGLGVISDGAPADLVVFAEDPTRNLEALASIRLVVADGRPYPKQMLDDAVGRYRAYYDGWLCDHFMMLMFRVFGRFADTGDHSH